ncbi:MAG TPA: D-alanyl-D-alanine carboxypeptidase [Candidatus Woesebacteria bacterium]|nr:D-alanyl-D-alanine carboxypeptidase [Candidatus Woesebacteria bacterium]HOG37553.1 D-alanyl-D-alanine carboxypeptidase [Candidatus Woesebacteria bacterium]
MPPKPVNLKNNWLDFSIFVLILLLNLFWLPTFSFWNIYPSPFFSSRNRQLLDFKSPPTPVIKMSSAPTVLADSYILVDVATNKILSSKNASQKIYPASTTKLATALTALNLYPLDEIVTVNQTYHEGKVMELKLGEKITVKSLVTALLVNSANDSAFTLADHYQHGSSIGFVEQMNLITNRYGLKHTNFINVDGIHHPNHFSTVYDLSQLGRISIKNPTLRELVKIKDGLVSDVTNTIHHPISSTNELLGVTPEIIGLKTGWTPEAKGCFIGLLDINGHEVISVVAQTDDRFQDTKNLIDWVKNNVSWANHQFEI